MNTNYHEGELAEAINRTINTPQELEIIKQFKSNYNVSMFNILKKKKKRIKEKYSFVFYHRSGYHIPLPTTAQKIVR